MIKNLIFDVGNVLFHYRWLEALVDTGMTKEQAAETGPKIFDETPLWRASGSWPNRRATISRSSGRI